MKTIVAIILFLLGLLTISCDKWLDVRSDDEIYVDDALIDRAGFVKALDGIYQQLGDPDLYGRELKFGMLDVMAGYWYMIKQHNYYAAFKFDYQDPGFQKKRDALWSKMYSAIHQCNILLEAVDNIKNDEYYNVIKGEVLGLRAFIHFELFKLFGPVTIIKGMDTPAIPYHAETSKVRVKFSTSRVCLSKIEQDLLEAKNLLKDDPIKTQGRIQDGNTGGDPYNSLLDRRGIRMNYYAVVALLARQALYEGNMPKTMQWGEQLLTELNSSKAVRLIDKDDLLSEEPKDNRWTMENIWGLYIRNMKKNMDGSFSGLMTINTMLVPDFPSFLDQIYTRGTGNISDYRYQEWAVARNFNKFQSVDFNEESTAPTQAYLFEMQLINLPEIYLILAEAYLDSNIQQALKILNTLRAHRGLAALNPGAGTTADIIRGYLMDEVRREYIGEGYLFLYYKRLFHDIYRSEYTIPAQESVFVLPLPADEILFNPPLAD